MADDNSPGNSPDVESLRAQLAAAIAEAANAKARIAELNNESKGHRLNSDKHRSEAETAAKARDEAIAEAARVRAEIEAQTSGKIKETETKAAEVMTKAQQKAVNADLRIAAKEAGASDITDVLALLPRDKLKISADGDVENADEVIAEFKRAKPHLFGSPGTTSNPNPPPKANDRPKTAADMSTEEWKAARARIRRGERV